MPVAATSGMAISMHALRRLVASSATFRTEVGVATEALALPHVYLFETNDEPDGSNLVDARPRAIINLPGYSIDKDTSTGSRETFDLRLAIELVPSSTIINGGTNDQATWFANVLGAIMTEMLANSGGANGSGEAYANVVNIGLDGRSPASNIPDDDPVNQFFWGADLRVELR